MNISLPYSEWAFMQDNYVLQSSTDRTKGGFLSEKFGQFFHLPKIIPFFCFKFVHPIHDVDNMSIVKKSTFTGFIYVQVQKVGFTITTDNLICSQHLKH